MKVKNSIKKNMTMICPNCSSENVEIAVWINPNTMELSETEIESIEAYCNDCDSYVSSLVEVESKLSNGDKDKKQNL